MEEFGGTTGPACDLDLRLSATDARFGRLSLKDMAANVIARPGRIEAALGRAELRKGTVKGRLALTAAAEDVELRTQAIFDGVELPGALVDLGQPRWITGQASGQITLESTGRSPAEIVRRSHGRASIAVRNGELVGIGFGDALKRLEKRPLTASFELKGGRTAFDHAQASLVISGGIGEITDAVLSSSAFRASAQGRVSLIDRVIGMRTQVETTTASIAPIPAIAFEIRGGWDDVAIVPDAKALIERSGAAKPLLGSAPTAAAQ
jgi:AsmA protein